MHFEIVVMAASLYGILVSWEAKGAGIPVVLFSIGFYLWGWSSAHHKMAADHRNIGVVTIQHKAFRCEKVDEN